MLAVRGERGAMVNWLRWWLALIVLLALAPGGAVAQQPTPQPLDDRGAEQLARAVATQSATRARLGVLGDAFVCADARFVSFRRSDAEPQIADQWYVASQLWADAVLLRVASRRTGNGEAQTANGEPQASGDGGLLVPGWDARDTQCYLDKGFVFLDRLWDYTSAGYFARANPVGGDVDRGARFTDDNLIAGLALLDAARASADDYAVRRYVHAARREADFLLLESAGLWDPTFGGGFWWNTGRGDSQEGKPAQTNALAALFFARLYEATNDVTYRDWALRSLLWLDTILFDPTRHLYRWSVSFADVSHRAGAIVSQRYFNYDQAIAVEAQLAAQHLDNDRNRLIRARDIARSTHTAFWSADLGGYNLEAGVDQVFTSYGAWTSFGFFALFDVDQDPTWLELASQNVQAFEARLREADHGFAYRTYRCVDRIAKGCESGQVQQVVDHTRDTAAQAWVQHLQSALAERLPPAESPAESG
jgi:hypothetical protein